MSLYVCVDKREIKRAQLRHWRHSSQTSLSITIKWTKDFAWYKRLYDTLQSKCFTFSIQVNTVAATKVIHRINVVCNVRHNKDKIFYIASIQEEITKSLLNLQELTLPDLKKKKRSSSFNSASNYVTWFLPQNFCWCQNVFCCDCRHGMCLFPECNSYEPNLHIYNSVWYH